MPSITDLAKKFDIQTLCPDGNWIYTSSCIKTRDEPISAEQYLKFAENDLSDGESERHLINALTNAKRALHLRMEDVCLGFGFASYGGMRSFPRMVEFIARVGVTAPRILNRLNQLRNQVEHEYLVPSRSEVETFIDVTSLFAASTQRWINRQPSDIEIHQCIVACGESVFLKAMTFSWEAGLVRLHFADTKDCFRSQKEVIEFRCPAEEFFLCARLALDNEW
ncbi:hypothetical protein [Burkholderia gladioli]|uniref:DUF4145 domain-containing protein n=1 Tax=Burkholderia gladioli TaxID=28095 RepID=A0AB38TR41_BURGA|nr:hypothetical protein [Burkholderia gladioli]MBU9268641.1 hypothetical protein [Burkholderia gladioli]MBU9274783.1 hypothetical protein [Burkholderia gladioli]MBU9683541.1 hypothetical protein [Burkholderia gladioli]MCA8171867.1 hypothetical protein [Burkholderia gladioli]PRE29524.1 hypothetical protein C6P72_05320 [Burkholderia gladioli]